MSENNNIKTDYIGLTIGPIYKTLNTVKSTRALFTGSYIFSLIMREMMEAMFKEGISKENILIPSPFF